MTSRSVVIVSAEVSQGAETQSLPDISPREHLVLVVDDSEEVLCALSDVLQDAEYKVLKTSSAGEALSLLEEQKPDIIICDVMMPEMDGFEFHYKVRQNSELSHVPFVFLTALNESKQVQRGKELGCDDYLTKPFEPDELLAVVKGKILISKHREQISENKLETYRKRIIHTLSHEFRTPLVAINTGTELLIDHGKNLSEEKNHHLLESIQRGGKRLQRLVEDFMMLQQIYSGSAEKLYKEHSRSISCPRLVRNILEKVSEEREPTSISTNFDYAAYQFAEGYKAKACEIQIADALSRILQNAYKFSPEEGTITVSLSQNENEITILIQDQGKGIQTSVKEDVCKMFTQIGREKFEQQGCGLGLNIASYFVELNKGRLELESAEDQVGTTVRIILPRAEDE